MHESFWQYSCRVYRAPAVSTSCLELQNQHGLDVNLLLFAVWYGCTRGPLPVSTQVAAQQFSRIWSKAVVRRLRKARTWLKHQALEMDSITPLARDGVLELREQIKAIELQSEHFQQDRLEALCETPRISLDIAEQRNAATENLHALLQPSEVLEQDLQKLLTALFEPRSSAPQPNA